MLYLHSSMLIYLLNCKMSKVCRLSFFTYFIFAICSIIPAEANEVVKKITIKDGLPSNVIYCSIVDHQGFMWFGTDEGLSRYDGSSLKNFTADNLDNLTIPNDAVLSLYEDSQKRIWVGTKSGICYLSYPTRTPIRLQTKLSNITSIDEKPNGDIIILAGQGVYSFGADNLLTQKNSVRNEQDKELSLIVDAQGRIWTISSNGIVNVNGKVQSKIVLPKGNFISSGKSDDGKILFFVLSKTIILYDLLSNHRFSLSIDGVISSAFRINRNHLIAIKKDGNILVLDLKTKNAQQYTLPKLNGFISSAVAPTENTLVLSTLEQGVVLLTRIKTLFTIANPLNFNNGKNQIYKSLYITKDGIIAACAWSDGFVLLNKNLKKIAHYSSARYFKGASVQSVEEDLLGNIYIGTIGEGLFVLNKTSKLISKPKGLSFLEKDNIWILKSNGVDGLWIGTQQKGLIFYNFRNQHADCRFATLKNADIREVIKLDSNLLIVGTLNKGTFFIDLKTGRMVPLIFRERQTTSIGSYDICKDPTHSNILWVGTDGFGLLKVNISKRSCETQYTAQNGLSSNVVKTIQFDNNGEMWLATVKGICKFNTTTGVFINQIGREFISDWVFSFGSSICLSDGKVVLGSSSGLVAFYPNDVKKGKVKLPIINSFKAGGKELGMYLQGRGELPQHISHSNNSISIDFSSIHYDGMPVVGYRYKLEGIDPCWHNVEKASGSVNYMNLSSGRYTFRVQLIDPQNTELNYETAIQFKVNPPFAASPVMLISYFCLLLLGGYALKKSVAYKRKVELELLRHEYELESVQQMYKLRLKFFANISHEFRTPLTLIASPIATLLTEVHISPEKKLAMYRRIERNARRLLNLVSQITDLRKMDEAQSVLTVAQFDIGRVTGSIFELFTDQADEKSQILAIESDKEELKGWIDRDKYEKIVVNLISNALKYSGPGATIKVCLNIKQSEKMSWLVVKIGDNGVGISPDLLPGIFDDFSKASRLHGGVGLGLSFTKRLVELHHGRISVNSEKGVGTTFWVELPIDKDCYKEHELYSLSTEIQRSELRPFESTPQNFCSEGTVPTWKLMVVDDDTEMRKYIAEIFSDTCEVIEAPDATAGFRKAAAYKPSLILCDVVMQRSSGIELLKRLKEDERTSHIPVILLTAQTGADTLKAGYAAGADAYLIKPFDEAQLKFNVLNLLKTQHKLLSSINTFGQKEIGINDLSSIDRRFLKKVIAAVERNLDNYEFDIKDLCQEIGESRTLLYRKMKETLNMSANEFIRMYRLKRAAILLGNKHMNVGEVMIAVGFNNRSYFNRCFKDFFGMTPVEYMDKFGER